MKKLLFAALAVGLLIAAACNDTLVHILTGQQYFPQFQCLTGQTSFDVVNGGETANDCAPSCLTIDTGDASSIYVTTVCGPFPQPPYTVEMADAATGDCVGAFQAFFSDAGTFPTVNGVVMPDAACPPFLPEAGAEGGADGGATDAAPASDAATADAGAGDAAVADASSSGDAAGD